MPYQTRSSTRTTSLATRASSTLTRSSRETKAPNTTPRPGQNGKAPAKAASKPKPNRKTKPKEDSPPAPKRARRLGAKHDLQSDGASEIMSLMSLPVEVLIEIARYFHPLDLIMLSRVNKFLRELFMDKHSARIWRSARENLAELPPCPDEISEPQYAAMLFTKRCSTCGGYAPREMDSVMLIRLCTQCWWKQLVDAERVTDPSLLALTRAPVPGDSRKRMLWCLYSEARAVKVELNKLTEAGDEEALQQWKEERQQLVKSRYKNAEPLSEWLRDKERKRVQDQDGLKAARQKEIESRLIELGWEQSDFRCYEEWRLKDWASMVFTTKPLTEQAWDNILPRLLDHLKVNHEERLKREQARRKSARNNAIESWFTTIRGQLSPYARAVPSQSNDLDSELDTTASIDKPVIQGQAFPDRWLTCEWSEYKKLVENDIPHEQFLVDFEKTKPEFQRLTVDWRNTLEARLIEMLPSDTCPPDFNATPFTMTVVTGKRAKPMNKLPVDIQKLLRADVIFANSSNHERSSTWHYPHTYGICGIKFSEMSYNSGAHEVAKALLNVLGLPDASHLGLEAYGKAFRCGRCPQGATVGYYWRDIIDHYIDSVRSWEAKSKDRKVQAAKGFVYVCTHDIGREGPDRPLVWISTKEDTANPYQWNYSKCLLCHKVGLYASVPTQAIVDHVREVHLVEEPTVKVHYK
ncbi:unnamed protein product [Rhizoctonia solani]|uniref:F-box domain-containing protein n=1 Tax=Rhizoctonia solani TaxID=456999 RepID=A0A8H3CC73_9AGAM|nr:unnamed protein product [Rhizoctonia solani]